MSVPVEFGWTSQCWFPSRAMVSLLLCALYGQIAKDDAAHPHKPKLSARSAAYVRPGNVADRLYNEHQVTRQLAACDEYSPSPVCSGTVDRC